MVYSTFYVNRLPQQFAAVVSRFFTKRNSHVSHNNEHCVAKNFNSLFMWFIEPSLTYGPSSGLIPGPSIGSASLMSAIRRKMAMCFSPLFLVTFFPSSVLFAILSTTGSSSCINSQSISRNIVHVTSANVVEIATDYKIKIAVC